MLLFAVFSLSLRQIKYIKAISTMCAECFLTELRPTLIMAKFPLPLGKKEHIEKGVLWSLIITETE